jgi:hypothetical protein
MFGATDQRTSGATFLIWTFYSVKLIKIAQPLQSASFLRISVTPKWTLDSESRARIVASDYFSTSYSTDDN